MDTLKQRVEKSMNAKKMLFTFATYKYATKDTIIIKILI